MQFSDISIVPQYSNVLSRADVNLEYSITTRFSQQELKGFPVFISNMDTTGTFSMAREVNKFGFYTCLHKYYTKEQLISFFKTPESKRSFITVGINTNEVNMASELVKGGYTNRVCFDIANGYIKYFHSVISDFRLEHPKCIIIAGNVCTKEGVNYLRDAGADIIKCGIANGSACDTKNKAGVCIPQPDTIIDCSEHGVPIISDGGCKTPADIVKSLALGAEYVMCGGMFAGYDECEGEWEYDENNGTKKTRLKFYGMSSKTANIKYNGGLKEYRASEGKEFWVDYKGKVADLCIDIGGSLASACTYSNADNLHAFHQNVEWKKICN